MRRRDPTPRARGVTLLEVAVSVALLGLLMGLALGSFANVQRDVGDGLSMADAAAQANRVAKELHRQLSAAGGHTLSGSDRSPTSAFTSVTYRPALGFDFAERGARWGPTREVRFELDEAGPDGRDDDGDGLVDQGRLVLYEDGRLLVTLLHDVAADGVAFAFGPVGGGQTAGEGDGELRVRFVRLQRLPRDGDVHRERRDIRVALRNR